MCLGLPGRVIQIAPEHPDVAEVDVSGVRRSINIGLLAEDELAEGDWVLIHMGFALSTMHEQEAKEALDFLEGITRAYAEESDDGEPARLEGDAS